MLCAGSRCCAPSTKLDKFGPEGVRQLLGPGRWDGGKEGEGDFAKGAGLDKRQIDGV